MVQLCIHMFSFIHAQNQIAFVDYYVALISIELN